MKSKVCLLCTTHLAFHAFVRRTHNTAANDVFQVAEPASAFCAVGTCSVSVLTLFSGRIPHNARKCGVEQIKPFEMCTVRSGDVF
jgi:hypothetical protein